MKNTPKTMVFHSTFTVQIFKDHLGGVKNIRGMGLVMEIQMRIEVAVS